MGENQGALAAHGVWFVPSPSTPAIPLTRDVVVPVNSVSWAPHELGAILACASSDGKISVLTFKGALHRPATPTMGCSFSSEFD